MMTTEERVEMLKHGGLRAILAYAYQEDSVYDRKTAYMALHDANFSKLDIVDSNLYWCIYDPFMLINEEWRTKFLTHYTEYRVYSNTITLGVLDSDLDAVLDLVVPEELCTLLLEEDEPRWLITNPALRLYNVEQFYNLEINNQ